MLEPIMLFVMQAPALELVRDLPNQINLTLMINLWGDHVHIKPGAVYHNDIYHRMNSTQRLVVWEHNRCPDGMFWLDHLLCEEFIFNTGSGLHVDPNLLWPYLDAAMSGLNNTGMFSSSPPPCLTVSPLISCLLLA